MAAESQLEDLVSQLVRVCVCLPDFSSTRSYWGGEVSSGREGQIRGGGQGGGGSRGDREGAWERRDDNNTVFIWQPKLHRPHPHPMPANGSLLIMFPAAAAALEGDRLTRVWKLSQIKRGKHLARPLLLHRRGGVAGFSPGHLSF